MTIVRLLVLAVALATCVRGHQNDDQLKRAQDFFLPILNDPQFNPNLRTAGFSSESFYEAPSVHPFESKEDMIREQKRDPFGFSTTQFRSSFLETRYLQMQYEHTQSRSVERMLGDRIVEGKRIIQNIERTLPKEEGGQTISLKYDVTYVRGLVSLEAETHHVKSVDCSRKNKLHLNIEEGSMNYVSQWIPGTRFIVSPELSCSLENTKPLYFLLVRRHKLSETDIEYDVEPIVEQDCYVRSSIDFNMKPDQDFIHSLETAGFQDLSNFGQTLYSLRYDENQRSKFVTRQSIDRRFSYSLLNYNYNQGSGRAQKTLPFVTSDNLRILCTDCFAYMGFELHFRMDTTFVKINILEATIRGLAKFSFVTLFDFSYQYKNTFEKRLLAPMNFPAISFSVGMIPMRISPSLALDGRVDVDVKAKFQMTHSAVYTDTLTVGFSYEKGVARRIYNRQSSGFDLVAPKVSSDSKATASLKVTLIPRLTLSFYSVAPLQLSVLPYIKLSGLIGNGPCGAVSASYNTHWGLTMGVVMQKLKVPQDVYGIGGKEFDLGGLLPFPKSASDSSFVIVGESPLTCTRCSGCVNLAKIWSTITRSTPVSFLEGSSTSRRDTNDVTVIRLGKSIVDQPVPLPGTCHFFRTTSLSDAIPASEIFGGSRRSQVQFEVSGYNKLALHYGPTEESVRSKSGTSRVVNPTYLLTSEMDQVYFSICNEHELPSSVSYSFQSRPYAFVNSFGVSTPSLTLESNMVVRLGFVSPRTAGPSSKFLVLSLNLPEAGQLTAVASALAFRDNRYYEMNRGYMIREEVSSKKEVSVLVSDEFPHTHNDHILEADIFAPDAQEIVSFSAEANAVYDASLRTPFEMEPYMNLVRLERGNVVADRIWKYFIRVVRSNTLTDERFCVFAQQWSSIGIPEADKFCFNMGTEATQQFEVSLPEDVVLQGYGFLMAEFSDNHSFTEVYVDEQRSVGSGEAVVLTLRSDRPDRYVFDRTSESDSENAPNPDYILISGYTRSHSGVECNSGECTARVAITLQDNTVQPSVIVFEKETDSSFGKVHTMIDYSEIRDSLEGTLESYKDKLHTLQVVVDITGTEQRFLEFWIDEVYATSETSLTFENIIQPHPSSEEMIYYHIPSSLIKKLGDAVVARVTSTPRENNDVAIPHLLVRRESPPRFSANDAYAYSGETLNRVTIIPQGDDSSDYYVGINTQSAFMSYTLALEPLPASRVSVKFSCGPLDGDIENFSMGALREHGLTMAFSLESSDQAWSPKITDPLPEGLSTRLIAALRSNTNPLEWDVLQRHMITTLNRALGPNADIDATTILEFSPREIKYTFPAFDVGELSIPNDMTIFLDPTIDRELLVSRDPRLTIKGQAQFIIEKTSQKWMYFIIPLAVGIPFLVLLALGFAVVGCIMYKTVVQSRRAKGQAPSSINQTLLLEQPSAIENEDDLFTPVNV